jgi:ATP-dependent Clp protease ATP-binding subunit ClpA
MQRTTRCRGAIDAATQACRRFGHSQLGSGHLVLGLLTLNGGVGDTLLKRAGLSADTVERYLSSKRSGDEESLEEGGAVFGKSARDALARAEQEATAFSHGYLGVEHLTLALLSEQHGDAADLFASVHIDRGHLKRAVVAQMS